MPVRDPVSIDGVTTRSGDPIDAGRVANRITLEEESGRTDLRLRKFLAWTTMILTFLLNGFTIWFIFWLASIDREQVASLAAKYPERAIEISKDYTRMVTPAVVMSLLGATVVQVGTALVVITQHLFPKPH